MIKIENIQVFNWEGAIRGMRNPLNSWDKSDSYTDENGNFVIGAADHKLAQHLVNAGPDHSKFLRQIFVSMDITAPLMWWKEMDTYKVATVSNSGSTMHTLTKTPITRNLFSFDAPHRDTNTTAFIDALVGSLERLRQAYLITGDKSYWRALIELLPESWNQRRTWTANYAVLRSIYFARRNHKLDEWHKFCDMIETLPYASDLITYEKGDSND